MTARLRSLAHTLLASALAALPLAASSEGCGGSVMPTGDTRSPDASGDHTSPPIDAGHGRPDAVHETPPDDATTDAGDEDAFDDTSTFDVNQEMFPDAGGDDGGDDGGGFDAGDDGGGDDDGGFDDGGGDGGSDTNPSGEPPAPSGSSTASTTAHNFAIHHLYVGDDTPNPMYTPSLSAWKSIGYNIDGLDSAATSTNVCTPYTHGTTQQQIDGDNGIDNAFGSQIAPQLALIGNLSQTISEKIIDGVLTTEIDTVGLTASATQTNTALGGQLFTGASYGSMPPLTGTYFSMTDSWPVTATSLTNGATLAGGSKVNFPAAYVTSGTWVSGTPVTLNVPLALEGVPLVLTIHHAVVTFVHTVDASGQGHGSTGILSGVLSTTEFISAINTTFGSIQGGADCAVVSTILPLIQNSQDIILDPTTGDVSNTAGTPCNAISIGLAFDADEIQPPSTVAPNADAGAVTPCGG